MISEKSLRIAFVIVSLGFLWMLLKFSLNTEKSKKQDSVIHILQTKNDSLQKVCDSLHDENFSSQIELGRYQVAYQIFMERNPKAASQFGDIISNETE